MCARKLCAMALDASLNPAIQLAAASRVIEYAFRGEEIEDLAIEIAELRERIEVAPNPELRSWGQVSIAPNELEN